MDLWEENNETLFWSIIIDKRIASNNYENPYTNEWNKAAYNKAMFFRYTLHDYPELTFVQSAVVNDFTLPFTSAFFATLFNPVIQEGVSFILFDLIAYLFCAFVVVQFLTFLFSFYDNPNSNESTVDSDYLVSSMSVESEEEIASVDDLSLGLYLLMGRLSYLIYLRLL
jgi:hypothetical protein